MFIIFGSPRSGTTLLTAALNLHSQIFIPDETDFIVPMIFIFDRVKEVGAGKALLKQLITKSERFPASLGVDIAGEEVASLIETTRYHPVDLLNTLYAAAARKRGKSIGGDKSPNDLMDVYMFAKMGILDSEIKIVHILRDVRDVVLSIQKTGWVPQIENFFPRVWTESNLFLYERMVGKANYFMLKYEELVENPATKLSQISSFLRVPFEPETLAEKRTGRHSRQPQHANINKPFLGSRVFAWKEEMDARVEQICRVQAAEALWKFDYELDADRERLGGIPRP